MKKSIILLALLGASLITKSQITTQNGTLTLVSIQPTSVCECDSVYVTLKLKWTSGFIDTSNVGDFDLFLRVFDPDLGDNKYLYIRTYTAVDFWEMTHKIPGVTTDTTYSYWQVIPCGIVQEYRLSETATYILAEFTLFGPHITGGHPVIPLFIKNCAVGIEEYELNGEKCIYYDLFGNVIEPEKNKLMIRQVGRTRQKVIIQD